MLALTDHDTLAGCDEALVAAATAGIRLVPGIELSVRTDRGTFHLLGHFATSAPAPLVARMDEIATARERRNAMILARLAVLGAPLDPEAVAAYASGRIGRPHIAAALVEAGHASDVTDAFDRLIGDGQPAHVPAGALDPIEAVRLVKTCGGAATLAHPATLLLEPDVLDRLVAELAAVGLDAVEVVRIGLRATELELFASIAARHRLLATGGSDYHGPAGEEFGICLGQCGAAPTVLQALLERIA